MDFCIYVTCNESRLSCAWCGHGAYTLIENLSYQKCTNIKVTDWSTPENYHLNLKIMPALPLHLHNLQDGEKVIFLSN